MSNPISDWIDSLYDKGRADYELQHAINWEAVARAKTKLIYAQTELEMAQAQHAVVAELNRAIQQSPELRGKLVAVIADGNNPFANFPGGGSLPSNSSRQIVSSGSNKSTDDWG